VDRTFSILLHKGYGVTGNCAKKNPGDMRLTYMIVHLFDGTYELFRHFYGLRRFNKGKDHPYGAVVGVLQTVLQMIENGDRHLGVATEDRYPIFARCRYLIGLAMGH
jgi:hypothetical protein